MTQSPTPDDRPQPYAPIAPATGGGAGTAALVIGLVLVLLGLVQQLVSATMGLWLSGIDGYAQVGLIFGAFTIVGGTIAIAGVVCGLVGIQPAHARGRLAAAAGLAISAAHLLGALVALVAPIIVGLVAQG
jgi:hypothetical protein